MTFKQDIVNLQFQKRKKHKLDFIMKLSKSDTLYLIRLLLVWTFINLTLNMFGLWFTKLLKPEEFVYLDNIMYEFVKPLAIQSLIFGLITALAYLFMKNKKIALYSFVALQFLAFHVIFFMNIKFNHGLHFVSTFKNPGVQYLSYCGQYMVDILYLYFPVNGNFENGLFIPENTGTFYLHWILLNIVYYFGLMWLAIQAVKYFFEKTDKKSVNENEKEIAPKVKE